MALHSPRGRNMRLDGQLICFTGKLEYFTREEAEQEARIRGATPRSSVTAGLDILVIGERPGSTKLRAARQYAVQQRSEQWFIAAMGLNPVRYNYADPARILERFITLIGNQYDKPPADAAYDAGWVVQHYPKYFAQISAWIGSAPRLRVEDIAKIKLLYEAAYENHYDCDDAVEVLAQSKQLETRLSQIGRSYDFREWEEAYASNNGLYLVEFERDLIRAEETRAEALVASRSQLQRAMDNFFRPEMIEQAREIVRKSVAGEDYGEDHGEVKPRRRKIRL